MDHQQRQRQPAAPDNGRRLPSVSELLGPAFRGTALPYLPHPTTSTLPTVPGREALPSPHHEPGSYGSVSPTCWSRASQDVSRTNPRSHMDMSPPGYGSTGYFGDHRDPYAGPDSRTTGHRVQSHFGSSSGSSTVYGGPSDAYRPLMTPPGEHTTTEEPYRSYSASSHSIQPAYRRQVDHEAYIPGRGLCFIYTDGSVCPKNIDGDSVNPHWGMTKAGKPRKRLAQACTTCREKKIKCDPQSPKCAQCQKFGRECRFDTS